MKKLIKVTIASVLALGLIFSVMPEVQKVEAKSVATDAKLAAKGLALYTTKKAESVTNISRKTGTSADTIKVMNGLKSNTVKGNKSLLVKENIQNRVKIWLHVTSVNTKNKQVKVKRVDNGRTLTVIYSNTVQKDALVNIKNTSGQATFTFSRKGSTYYVATVKKGFN